MKSVQRVSRVLVSLALGCALALGVVGPTAPASADYDLGVTWPDVAAFDPVSQPYTITVVDSGPGTLYAHWGLPADPAQRHREAGLLSRRQRSS
jgi:hypothetical protein